MVLHHRLRLFRSSGSPFYGVVKIESCLTVEKVIWCLAFYLAGGVTHQRKDSWVAEPNIKELGYPVFIMFVTFPGVIGRSHCRPELYNLRRY